MPVPTRIYARAKRAVWRHIFNMNHNRGGMITRRRGDRRAAYIATRYVRSINGQRVVYRLANSMARSRRYR